MKIIGDHIILRTALPEDIDVMLHWENLPETKKYNLEKKNYTRQEISDFVNGSHDIYMNKQLRLMIRSTENESIIGTVDLFEYDEKLSSVGVGIYIFEKTNRRKYFASDTMELVLRYASKHLYIREMFCNIHPDNKKSIAFFESKGFEKQQKGKVGAIGKYWIEDMLFFIFRMV